MKWHGIQELSDIVREIVERTCADVVTKVETLDDCVRIFLEDESVVDIRYPCRTKYSFHWQRKDKMYRVDTAPHHRDLASYPRHIHYGKEGNVIEDTITDGEATPAENIEAVMEWIRNIMENPGD